jgi:hypothetical protein
MEQTELEKLTAFKQTVVEMARVIREEHLRPEHFEHKTFYPDHPLVLLAALVEAIEELTKEQA